jgi:hypothetical protein
MRSSRSLCSRSLVVAISGAVLGVRSARAEVTLADQGGWEVFTAGRVDVFLGHAFGDGYPPSSHHLIGGGADSTSDVIFVFGPGGQPNLAQQGTLSKLRFHSGFIPNVLTLGLRRSLNETTKMRGQLSVWGTIETTNQVKYVPIVTDFREGYLEIEGRWGTFTAGRFDSLFSRGIGEVEFLYGHGYGVGSWGEGGLYNPGPSGGLIGFGVLASTFSPGAMYTTPTFGGFKVSAALFDGVKIFGPWDGTRTPRPETEITYDLASERARLHLFCNGAYQKLYRPFTTDSETVEGIGYGGRFELGPLHIGGGGHYGKGLGLYYALEESPASYTGPWDLNPGRLRTMDGYAVFGQYVLGSVDLNVAYGVSRVHLLDVDKRPPPGVDESVIKTQTGVSGAVVYHVSENLHFDLDYLRAMFAWYAGEKQVVNYINTGIAMTW